MSLPVVVQPIAQADLLEARNWYDGQQEGLGDQFSRAAESALLQVGETPSLFPSVEKGLLRVKLRRFPYLIYYRVFNDRVEVLAVFHSSRNPRIWKNRA